MSISKKEIAELKKSYELKVNIFDLVRKRKNEEAINLLKKDNDASSYFLKFKSDTGRQQVFLTLLSGELELDYDVYAENKILTDLNKIKKEIEEKEARYEQQKYLNQQKEFLDLQKRDIIENKEDRKKTQRLTFVLAFGIIITSIFYLFQISIEFKKSETLHTLIISGIFILIFSILILFTLFVFDLKKEATEFFKKNLIIQVIPILIIAILFVFLLTFPDGPLNNDSNNESTYNVKLSRNLSEDNIMPKTNDSITNENLDNSKENISKLNLSEV